MLENLMYWIDSIKLMCTSNPMSAGDRSKSYKIPVLPEIRWGNYYKGIITMHKKPTIWKQSALPHIMCQTEF